jgi:serine/threonine-protein kinase
MAYQALVIKNRYRIEGGPIAQGAMGSVYKAYDFVTRRHVAVKTMRGPLDRVGLNLLAEEWNVLAQISHPNIANVLDTGDFEQDGERLRFFVMPFLVGVSLEQILRNSPRLTPERVIAIIVQTCRPAGGARARIDPPRSEAEQHFRAGR